jgi:hypothetical protein
MSPKTSGSSSTGYNRIREARRKKIEELKEWAADYPREIAEFLLPDGEEIAGNWCVADISGAPGKSLKIDLSSGWWRDWNPADGEEKSQDLIALWMAVREVDFNSAIKEMQEFVDGEIVELHRSNGNTPPKAHPVKAKPQPIYWSTSRDAARENAAAFAKWRGYRREFVDWLIQANALGYSWHRGWLFPRRGENGEPESYQTCGKEGEHRICSFLPVGSQSKPYVVGNPITATTIVIAESQFDVLACGDLVGLEKFSDICLISTFGSGNAKLVPTDLNPKADINLLPQNDAAGKVWLENVIRHLGRTVTVVTPPEGIKDFNDWTRTGPIRDDFMLLLSKVKPPPAEISSNGSSPKADESDEAAFHALLNRTHWIADANKYYFQVPNGNWLLLVKGDLRRHLISGGLSGGYWNPFLIAVQSQQEIEWAGQLAGFPAGRTNQNGYRCLITRGPTMIEPVQGNCEYIRRIIEELLPGGQHHYLLARTKLFLEALRENRGFHFSQAIVIVGEKAGGKSLVTNRIITPVIGNRQADATPYFCGGHFNDELGRSEHWVVDDQGDSKGFDRRIVSDGYKRSVAVPTIRLEAKYKNAINVAINRQITVLSNSGNKNLSLVPELTEDIEDKVILLQSAKANITTKPVETEARIRAELPAFVHWLMHEYTIPAEILGGGRFSIKAFHQPDLVRRIEETGNSNLLLGYIKSWLDEQFIHEWNGSSAKLHQKMMTHPDTRIVLDKICKSANSFSQHLGILAKKHPEIIQRDEDRHDREWRITFPSLNSNFKESSGKV